MIRMFVDNLLPVFLAAGAGWLLAARLDVEARSVSRLAFYVLAPCLIFRIVSDNALGATAMLRMAGFTATCLLGLGLTAAALGRLLGWSRPASAALVLVTLLPNAGNYGLSANLFAFGEAGLAHASIFFVTSAVLTFTVGVFVASLGRRGLLKSLGYLGRVPAIWAVVLAGLMTATGLELPVPLERTVGLLADACIPCFLVVLGLQLHGAGLRTRLPEVATAVALRLGAGTVAGLLLAFVYGLEGPARQAGVLQAAMPSAVINIVLATEYDVEPAFVTSAVFLSTVLSPLILAPLMLMLGA